MIYHTGTAGLGTGCTLTVSGAAGGVLLIKSGNGTVVFSTPSRPGTLIAPAELAQVRGHEACLVVCA